MAKRRGNGEGSIYQDSDGRWRAAVHHGFQNGSRKRQKLSGRTRTEVAEKLKKALRDQQQGLPVMNETAKFGPFLITWLEKEIKPKREYNTYRCYAQQIHPHIAPGLGHLSFRQLSPEALSSYYTTKHAELRDKLSANDTSTSNGARTVELQHSIIRCALNHAVKRNLVQRNVALLVDPPKAVKRRINPYDSREAVLFLQAVRGNRLEAVYTVAVACGLREGETLGLRWSDVNFDTGEMHVRVQLQRNESRKLTLKSLKNPTNEPIEREINLPGICLDALRRHRLLQQREHDLAGSRWVETGLVFTTRNGTPIDQRNLLRDYDKIAKSVSLRKIKFHDLRHTAGSLLLAMGVSMQAVSKILGHKDIRTTINIYGHVYKAEKREAAQKMDALLSPMAPGLAPELGPERLQ